MSASTNNIIFCFFIHLGKKKIKKKLKNNQDLESVTSHPSGLFTVVKLSPDTHSSNSSSSQPSIFWPFFGMEIKMDEEREIGMSSLQPKKIQIN